MPNPIELIEGEVPEMTEAEIIDGGNCMKVDLAIAPVKSVKQIWINGVEYWEFDLS